ncbi:MAG TPA: glycosyltransferase family 9 protein [Pyrinomonadaceae bacterium]
MPKLIDRLHLLQYKGREKAVTQIRLFQNLFSQQVMPQIDAATFAPKRVLFVLTGLLGDSVMSVPAIVAARKLWKDAHLTLLGKSHNCELLSGCPLIDEFYVCNADPFSLRNSAEIRNLQKWLADQKFDLAIILLGDHTARLLSKAKIPVRIGVKGRPFECFLTHTYDIGSPQTWGAAERLNALRCLNYEIEHLSPQLWVREEARKTAREKLANLGLEKSRSFVAVHPFGSEPRKWWNLEKIAPTAEILKQNYGLETVLLGGRETVSAVSANLKKSVIDTTGQFDIQELMAVIDESKAVITTDSGPFHLAGALGKPIVGLFRERSPQLAGQYATADVIFGQDEECIKQCGWDFCRTIPCRQLSDISAANVELTVKSIFAVSNS